jgi:trimeric autotransporter adhesin
MFTNNEKRRIGRLPLYVALLAPLPLGGAVSTAFAADATNEARCSAETTDSECTDNTQVSAGYRANALPNDAIGINAGGFEGNGGGITISTDGTTTAASNQDIAIGNSALANGQSGADGGSVAIGDSATASGWGSVALGNEASATGSRSVALGAGSVASDDNTLSIGNADQQRQLTYMAAGINATDGVNVSQLSPVVTSIGGTIDGTTGEVTMPTFTVQGDNTIGTVADAVSALDSAVTTNTTNITNLQTQIDNGTIGLVQQATAGAPITVAAGTDGTVVDFTGTAGTRTLTGLSIADLSETSTDAVNGSQLFATNSKVKDNADAIDALNTQLRDLESGTEGLVRQDVTSGNITVAAGTGGNMVNFAGTDGARVITGVAVGNADSATSTDAVNGGQLYTTNQAVSDLDTRVGTAEGNITTIQKTLEQLGAGIASGITYDDPDTKSSITLGGANGTLITNVANGNIAAESMDAINGGQLSAIQDNLQGQIGNINDRIGTIADGLGNVGNFDGNLDNQRITNLADGIDATDAATVGQVNQAASNALSTANAYTDGKFNALNNDFQNFKGEVNDRFNKLDQRVDRIGAMSAANTQMAINAGGVENTGKGRLAVGVGMQSSKAAFAVGYANKVNERVRMSLGAAFSGSEASIGAGAGFDL